MVALSFFNILEKLKKSGNFNRILSLSKGHRNNLEQLSKGQKNDLE